MTRANRRKKQFDDFMAKAQRDADESGLPQTIWFRPGFKFPFASGWTGWRPEVERATPKVTFLPRFYFA